MSEQRRLRVLLITRNLPPLVGGMERLNWHLADQLSRVAEVRIVGPAGSAALAPSAVKVREVPLRPLPRFVMESLWGALQEAREWKPDVVLAGSGLTAPLALFVARRCRATALAYVHGLDVAIRNGLYRTLWLPALRKMDRIIANSQATADAAIHAGVDPEQISIVHPGVELAFSPVNTQAILDFRTKHKLGRAPLLVSVGRLSARKGLREFVSNALPRIVASCPDLVLLVVGDEPRNALYADKQTIESIRLAAGQAGVSANVHFLGTITNDALLNVIYAAASVHVFPVREILGDPEGFGMVAVEAASHGLPTVAFATGGIVDAVAEGESGRLVSPGDYVSFAKAVIETLAIHQQLSDTCRNFSKRFAWPQFGAAIAEVLENTPSRATLP